jgi:hypothetical protein
MVGRSGCIRCRSGARGRGQGAGEDARALVGPDLSGRLVAGCRLSVVGCRLSVAGAGPSHRAASRSAALRVPCFGPKLHTDHEPAVVGHVVRVCGLCDLELRHVARDASNVTYNGNSTTCDMGSWIVSSFTKNCAVTLNRRHCERSEAIQGHGLRSTGLPRRFAPRNDAGCFRYGLVRTLSLRRARSVQTSLDPQELEAGSLSRAPCPVPRAPCPVPRARQPTTDNRQPTTDNALEPTPAAQL